MQSEQLALDYFSIQNSKMMETYFELLRIPSISTDHDRKPDMLKAANFLANYLKDLGMDHVAIHSTPMHPIIFAEKRCSNPQAQTLLIYGHYDVQPPDPLQEWLTAPFEPTIRGDYLYARGASDMKGQVLATIFALESVLKTGELPIHVKFILEGEEEIGSPSLDDFIESHVEMLKCDIILNADAGMIGPDAPTIVYALRGLVYFELRIDGPKADLHSGLWGGNVHNPAIVLSEIIAKLHKTDGSVAIPGFYDKVLALSEEERKSLATPLLSDESYLKVTGVPKLYGEEGYTPIERQGARPTLDVNGLYSGFIGEGAKTIIPAYAKAKISCRLVPNQDPDEIYRLAQHYIASLVPTTVRATLFKHSGGPSYLANDAPGYKNLSKALSKTWNQPITMKREGGSIPVATEFQQVLGVKSLLTGFGLPDDAIHSPNERQHLPTWRKGIQALIRFYLSFAS